MDDGLVIGRALPAMVGICLVAMLVALDQTVVSTAMPRVVADLNGFALYSWVATAYLLASSILVPITGRFGDLFGRKTFVMAAIAAFTGASALCGMVHSMPALVAARTLQGVGGGMLTGSVFAAVADIFPEPAQRLRWQAMLSTSYAVACAAGPVLGGYLTSHFDWRSVFFVNVPVGIAAFLVTGRYLPGGGGHRAPGSPIDITGCLLFAVATASFLLLVERAGAGEFHSPVLWALMLLAPLSAILLLRVERRAAQPILPLHLFRDRTIRLLALLSGLGGCAMFVLLFYSPLLLQGGFGLSPTIAGLVTSPLMVGVPVGSIVSGRLYGRDRFPPKLLFGVGLGLLAAGCALIATLGPDSTQWRMLMAFAVSGLGLGFLLPNLTVQMQIAVARADIGAASALVQSMRMLGSVVGTTVVGAIVLQTYHTGLHGITEAMPAASSVMTQLADPKILVESSVGTAIAGQGWALAAARKLLAAGVDRGVLLTLIVALTGLEVMRRLPSKQKLLNPAA
jgi:EmrB/QacA subfamily drug resistance transporter